MVALPRLRSRVRSTSDPRARWALGRDVPRHSTSDEILSDDDVRQFQLDVEELCLAIRDDSGLCGDGPTEIADRVWLIGRTSQDETPSRCIFLAFDTSLSPPAATVAVIKRTAGSSGVALLLINDADLEVRLALEDAAMLAMPILEMLANDAEISFRLDLGRLGSEPWLPRLMLRRADRSVTLDDNSVRLSPLLFKLMLFLVTEAQAGRPLVENRFIERKVWSTAIDSRQVADAIRRLRNELAPLLGGRERVDATFITSRAAILSTVNTAAIEIGVKGAPSPKPPPLRRIPYRPHTLPEHRQHVRPRTCSSHRISCE